MKQKILIFLIILSSFIAGSIGAAGFVYFIFPSLEESRSVSVTTGKQNIEIQNTTQTKKISIKNLESEITEIVENVSPSIVSIIINKDLVVYRSDPWGFFQQPQGIISRKVGGGSGFFIKSDGTILTNKHVVQDTQADYTVILSDGTEYPARVLALDPINDLAVIKIDSQNNSFVPLEVLAAGAKLQIGEFAIAVGNALAEFQNSVSLGIVSGKNRSIEAGRERLTGLLQTDAAINPGNSGGPLINLDGHVIGINTAIASNSAGIGFSFALTQERINYILGSIEEFGEIKRPFIGINYIPNSPGVARELGVGEDYGVFVINDDQSIVAGSSADRAGIKPGDLILRVNGEKITSTKLTEIIQNSLPGKILSLEILRGEERIDIELELGVN